MNYPRYKFAKESEPELLQFLRVAQANRVAHKNCDLKKYEIWNTLFPLDPTLIEKLNESDDNVININSEESSECSTKPNADNKDVEVIEDTSKFVTDIACRIKENFETLNDLSERAKEDIMKCHKSECEDLFKLLYQNLSIEQICNLGKSLQNIATSDLIKCFCNSLLIPEMQSTHSENLSRLVGSLYNSKHFPDVNKEVLKKLLEVNEDIKCFLWYLSKLNPNYKSTLLRDFIFSVENLNTRSLLIVEVLMNNQVEYQVLNKLIEMLSNIAEGHASDKAFGKLLMNVIEYLGSNVLLLEQPLRHIIAGHKSVLKSKLEKTFDTHYEDTLIFTQSFRD